MEKIPHYLMRQMGKSTFYDFSLQEKLRDFKEGQTFAFVTPEKVIIFKCIEVQISKTEDDTP